MVERHERTEPGAQPGLRRSIWIMALVAATVSLPGAAGNEHGEQPKSLILPSAETKPVLHPGDSADDVCIWIHPSDPSSSTVIGTDKRGGLSVYDLDGRQIQYLDQAKFNNVDLRYNFLMAGEPIAIVVAGNRTRQALSIFRVDPVTRRLSGLGHVQIGFFPVGTCMYYSKTLDEYYAFVDNYDGSVEQWRLFDGGHGEVEGERVREFKVAEVTAEKLEERGYSAVEACVADDETGQLYIAEEDVALWEYHADPGGDETWREMVHPVGPGLLLTPDIEGLAIYYGLAGAGYLIVSNQENDEFVVFDRQGRHRYLGRFGIGGSIEIDGVTHTDGIDVTNVPLGPGFPSGVFVAQDDRNKPEHQNFKFVGWDRIAVTLSLTRDSTWDPRAVGTPTTEPWERFVDSLDQLLRSF